MFKKYYYYMQREFDKRLFRLYDDVDKPERMCWNSTDIPELFTKALDCHKKGERVLDIGCGTGAISIALSQMGFEVTGVDLVGKAIEVAQEQAQRLDAKVEFITSNLLEYKPTAPFDVIVDYGCLHCMVGQYREQYLELIRQWLFDGGDFLLIHFSKKHPFDYRPVGPRRVSHQSMMQWMSPYFDLKGYASKMRTIRFPVGRVCAGMYHFQKKTAQSS